MKRVLVSTAIATFRCLSPGASPEKNRRNGDPYCPSIRNTKGGRVVTTDFGQGGKMKRIVAATAIAGFISVGLATPAFGATPAGQSPGNPSGTGNATQSCQSIGVEPGHASSSPGSPFNEPSATSSGGNGGTHYAGNGPSTAGKTTNGVGHTTNGGLVASQYDVACYHQPAK